MSYLMAQHGLSPYRTDDQGRTALMHAAAGCAVQVRVELRACTRTVHRAVLGVRRTVVAPTRNAAFAPSYAGHADQTYELPHCPNPCPYPWNDQASMHPSLRRTPPHLVHVLLNPHPAPCSRRPPAPHPRPLGPPPQAVDMTRPHDINMQLAFPRLPSCPPPSGCGVAAAVALAFFFLVASLAKILKY